MPFLSDWAVLFHVFFTHSFFNDVMLNQSMSYGDNLGSSVITDSVLLVFFLSLLVHWFSGLTMTSLFLVFDVSDTRDYDFDAANNNDRDGAIVAIWGWDGMRRLSVLPETSLFFVFDFVGDLDVIFDAADNDNKDTSGKNTANDQEHTVDGVEGKGDTSEMTRRIPLNEPVLFFRLFNPNLPSLFSVRDIICDVDWLVFVTVMTMNDSL